MDSSAPERPPLWLRRWPYVLLLLLVAGAYYGSYYRHGINFRDEGGTLTLLGQRLLNGEVPFRDVELGYNVGWFVPIVALFKITGVNFVALRIFFFTLSTLAAVLGFLTVERAARHAGLRAGAIVLGLIAGVLLILVPGMTFKNYNPLAAVANSWCLLHFVLAKDLRAACWRALIGGLVLGATWLVRIDLGTFFSVLWLGVVLARICERRFGIAFAGFAIVAASSFVMHGPVIWDAAQRGYYAQFTGAYPNHWKMLLSKLPGPAQAAPVAAAQSGTSKTTPAAPAPAVTPARQGTWKNETLARKGWSDVSAAKEKDRPKVLGLVLLTYLPLLTLMPLAAWAVVRWLRAVASGGDTVTPLAALVLLGGALTMFPQFFFWRPDAPHLSEFGPGFWTASLGATVLLGVGASWRSPLRWFAVVLVLHAGVWLWRMLPDRWCGTIAARFDRETLFEGRNGVRVYEQKEVAAWLTEILREINARSGPKDWLIAYPYHPAFNVLADRPTYERNVYVDNATAKPGWPEAAVQHIQDQQPALIIVSDWDINGTEPSRFRNWAAVTYAYIREHYDLVGTYDKKEKFELYARKKTSAVP